MSKQADGTATKPALGAHVLVLFGPSGAGKTTLIQALLGWPSLCQRLYRPVAYTTRAQRSHEVDGVAYHFVDDATFRKMSDDGEFLEVGSFGGNLYGTSLNEIVYAHELGLISVLDLNMDGCKSMDAEVRGQGRVRPTYVVVTAGRECLRSRMAARGDGPTAVDTRDRAYNDILGYASTLCADLRLENDDLAATTHRLVDFVERLVMEVAVD